MKWFIDFLKMNGKAQMEFELAYYSVAVKQVSSYSTETNFLD